MRAFPETASEYIELAERAVDRFSLSQNIDDLFTAILVTAHTFDFFHRENKGRPAEEADKQAVGIENPDWKIIRQLCNGGTRARLAAVGDLNPCPSAKRAIPDRTVWVVAFEGRERTLDFLCSRFLGRLKGRLSTRVSPTTKCRLHILIRSVTGMKELYSVVRWHLSVLMARRCVECTRSGSKETNGAIDAF
ncbi:hypothetical protein ABIC03_005322 [Bradyrhizobium sp. RT6a]